MGNWTTITGVGTGTVAPAPAHFVIDSAAGDYDPDSSILTVSLAVHPSADLGSTIGGHVYLEIPDISTPGDIANPSFRLAAAALGSGRPLRGAWKTYDAGMCPYDSTQQPWVVTLVVRTNTLHAGGSVTNVRAYVSAYSDDVELPLVRAGSTGETPSAVFAVDPNVKKPGSGSANAPNVNGITRPKPCISEMLFLCVTT